MTLAHIGIRVPAVGLVEVILAGCLLFYPAFVGNADTPTCEYGGTLTTINLVDATGVEKKDYCALPISEEDRIVPKFDHVTRVIIP